MVANIKGLDAYNSNAWRKNLSNWRNQNLHSRLKRVVKGRHWEFSEDCNIYYNKVYNQNTFYKNRKEKQRFFKETDRRRKRNDFMYYINTL